MTSNPKKVIIIGASSGIGKRLAELYAHRNESIGITGRRENLLKQIIDKYPQNINYECFDICSTNAIFHLQKLIDKLGGLDILIICAGTGDPSERLDWEIDKTTVNTNVTGFTSIANYTFNLFLNQGHGQLVTISSVAANRGGSFSPSYNASKSFQSKYFEGLSIKALKLKKKITITCIEPGFVDTKMAKGPGIFWLVPLNKAAGQIITAIDKGKRKAYISKRWSLIAWLMRHLPYYIYKRIG